MSTGSTGSFIPKWQVAILLGAPLAFGLGYLYYRSQSTTPKLTEESTDKKKISKTKDKSISLDGDDKLVDKETPAETQLQKVMRFKNEGNSRFKTGKFEEAIEFYNQAIETCPALNPMDLSTFYQNRAAAYEQQKKWSAVKEDCTKGLELNARYIKALFRRAKASENTNDLIASLEDITATCILEGFQNNSSLMFADRALKQLGRRDAKQKLLNRKVVIPSFNFLKAYFASFTKDPIVATNVENANSGFAKAKKSLEKGDYENIQGPENIVASCNEEISSNGKHKIEATLLRGTIHLVCGALKEAEDNFNAVINDPKTATDLKVKALVKRASLFVQTEKHQECFNDFAAAEILDPTNADIYHQRGQVFLLLEKLDEALNDFTQATELQPNFASSQVQKCYAEYRHAVAIQNQIEIYKAIQATNRIADKFPENVEVCNILAQILTEQEQYDKADDLFEKAIRLQPTHAALLVHRGLLQLQWNGDVNKALAYLNKAIKVDNKCELAYETLGTIQVQRGLLQEAIDLFETALKLCRSEAELVHIYSLRNAAIAQMSVAKKLNLDLSMIAAIGAQGSAFA